jgi:DNA-binding transcriptional ArsR family regulator
VVSQREAEAGRKPLKERTKLPDDALAGSVRHWIKVEALAIFHEGEFSAGEVAIMIGEDVKNVRNHIRELYEAGSIELAGYKRVGSYVRAVYRAIQLPVIEDKDARKMTVEERHDVSGAITQGLLAETVCSYRNGKLDVDPVCLLWDAPHLDRQGEQEMHTLLLSTWGEAQKIHGKSINRMAESGEVGQTSVIGLLGFERGRSGRPKGGYFKTGKNDWS